MASYTFQNPNARFLVIRIFDAGEATSMLAVDLSRRTYSCFAKRCEKACKVLLPQT
ncbi:hypothetical protein EV356DRAFT_504696 [Viridothelium virens]|uniref:Uncharacterized protein n=1 Tax=Viridothelium virens TaxID=1048519 RepID=A0A6A6H4D4_VIRVR|nr:hypothetical protein EV356DRAFT_504696 [Viridothelium virens]